MKKLFFIAILVSFIFHHLSAMQQCPVICMSENLESTKEAILIAQAQDLFVKLNLSYAGLEEIPDDFFVGINNIVSLSLAGNKLRSLPQMKNLVSLHSLNLELNSLTEIPDDIAYLGHLHILNIAWNQITLLPESIGFLYELEELYVSHNKLVLLPDSIGMLINLQIITLNNNNLVALPDTLICLAHLRSINMADNFLTADVETRRLSALHENGTKILGLPNQKAIALASGAE